MTITIRLPMLPPSLNAYRLLHWCKQHKLKKQWAREVFLEWHRMNRPKFQRVRITLVFTFPDRRRRDLDNYMATGSKFVGDAVKGLFIPDDIPEYLTGWTFLFERGTSPQTTIIIENEHRSDCSGLSCTGGS